VDELTMIRELLDQPAPSPEVVTEGRRRLLAEHARPGRRVRVRLWGALALGLTGVAVAAALAAAALGPGTGSTPGGGPAIVTIASARSVLLAAAVRAESAPAHGKYWHVRSMTRTTLPRAFGHGENRYTLEQLSVTERWTTHTGGTVLGRRQWVRPKTPADEAAWRRDGAPRRWCTGHTDTAPPQPLCLATSPGTASLTQVGPKAFQITEGHDLTFGQLQRLPTGAGALRAWLIRIARHDLDPSASAAVINLNVEEELSNLLVDFPVPPAVRASAFRALAGMPGVTSIGPARDELGRTGIGIEIHGPRRAVLVSDGSAVAAREGRFTRVLIIDPKTSSVLADGVTVGPSPRPVIDTLIVQVGWSNEAPQPPPL
jgi:hypothetical protein